MGIFEDLRGVVSAALIIGGRAELTGIAPPTSAFGDHQITDN